MNALARRLSLALLLTATVCLHAGSDVFRMPAEIPELEARGNWQQSLDEIAASSTPLSWLLIGPLPDKDFKQFDLPNGMVPDQNDDWTGQNTRVWNRTHDEDGAFLDLMEALNARTELLAYARTEMEWPVDGPALIWFDSFGRSIVYLNNVKIGLGAPRKQERASSARTMYPVMVQMKRGKNVLKIKIGQDRKPQYKDFGFFCRLERVDAPYLTALAQRLSVLYPDEAKGWRGAEAWLEIARRHESQGQREPAAAAYQKVIDQFRPHPNGDYLLEAETGKKRIESKAQPLGGDQIWKEWKKADEQFKALLRNADTSAADTLMRDYIVRFPLHESSGNALIFRGGLREDYNAAQSCQPYYERALREHAQNEFVRKFAVRGLDFVRDTRTERPQVAVQHEIQLAIDATRRQIAGGNDDEIASAFRSLLDTLNKSPRILLQIVDSPFYSRHAGLREYVRALLSHLGGKPLALYRQTVEKESAARFNEAKRTGQDAALGAIASDFFYTPAAAAALNELGNRYLDRGAWAQAAQTFKTLERDARGASGLPEALLAAKIAFALIRDGQAAPAREALDRLSKKLGTEKIKVAGVETSGAQLAAKLESEINKPAKADARLEMSTAETLGSIPRRSGPPAATPSPVPRGMLWNTPLARTESSRMAKDFWPEDSVYSHLQSFPVISGDRVFVSTLEGIAAYELGNGRNIWKQNWESKGSLFPWHDGRALFTGHPLSCPTVSEGRVYMRALKAAQTGLRCHDAANGKLIWNTETNLAFSRTVWLSDPLLAYGMAIAVFLEPEGADARPGTTPLNIHGVAAFDAASGELRWKSSLVTGAMGRILEKVAGHDNKQYAMYRSSMQLGVPAADNGIVYTPTGMGSLAALSAFTGEVIWLSGYPQLRSESLENGNSAIDRFLPRMLKFISRGPVAPIVSDDVVVLAPKDASGLIAFERQSGIIRWTHDLCDSRFLAGVCDGNVLVADNTVKAVALASGKTVWEFTIPADKKGLYAQPGFSGSTLYVPTPDVLLLLDARTGKNTGSMPWNPQVGALGNLVVSGSTLVGVNGKFIGALSEQKK